MVKKFSVLIVLVALVFSLNTKMVKASEGEFDVRNQVGEAARCWFGSVLMQDLNYQILYSCRDILYPGGTEVFSYIAWTTKADGGNDKLGAIGLGKGQFETKNPFVNIFITKEINSRTRSPQGPVVMSGGLQRFTILDNPDLDIDSESELGEPEVSPTPSPAPDRSGSNLFRIGGIVAFGLIFFVILLILVITRR